MAMASVSLVASLGLACTNAYFTYLAVEPKNLPVDKRIPAYFVNAEWWCPIVATVGYLCFCYFGKKFMMSRSSGVDEVVMKQAMRVYNLYQTLFNILCIVLCLRAHRDQKMLFWGNVTDFGVGGFGMSQFIWLHYNNKYVELLDTFFMVCRRKFEQLSFLHIYHHTLLIWSWFVVMKIEPGGDAYFGSIMNTGVHVIMYSYYFLASCGVQCFWKRYITQVQMLQFVIVASQSVFTIWKKNVHPVLPWLQLWVMLNMLVLFANFYRKSYSKKKKAT